MDVPPPRQPSPAPGRPAPGRLPDGEPIAVVDIGSNSVRLVIYERLVRSPTTLYNEKLMCGLGRDLVTTGRLPDEAVARALKAIRRFRILCRTAGVRRIKVLATAAARDAANGADFLREAAEACGCDVELLAGEREAALSAAGVISGFHAPDGVVGDLGGGSLELVDVAGAVAGPGLSLPLGGLVLKDRSGSSPKAARAIVRDALGGAPHLAGLAGRTFYAVGGTWRAIARLQMSERAYPLNVMHGYVLDVPPGGFLKMIERSTPAALKAMANVAEARRPLLVYGAVVLDEIVRIGRPGAIAVSVHGVREGFLYSELDGETRRRDPLIDAASELNDLRARDPRHAADLCAWTDAFVRAVGLRESPEEARLRHAACFLSDVGWRAHPDYRGEQSLVLIAHGAFLGIDHPGRAYLALATFFRHEGVTADEVSPALLAMAGARGVVLAQILAACLRVAFPITVGTGGTLARTPLGHREGRVVLTLPGDLAGLASERLAGRLKVLGRLLERDTAIAVD